MLVILHLYTMKFACAVAVAFKIIICIADPPPPLENIISPPLSQKKSQHTGSDSELCAGTKPVSN